LRLNNMALYVTKGEYSFQGCFATTDVVCVEFGDCGKAQARSALPHGGGNMAQEWSSTLL